MQLDYNQSNSTPGYVTHSDNTIILGLRMSITVENSMRFNYSFTEKMGLDFRLRHYWSKVDYNGFQALTEDGGMTKTNYDLFNDFAFSLFYVDLNYRWRFASGSDIIINWKSNISGISNDESINYHSLSYFDGIKSLKDYPEQNSLSLRVIYYIDYQQICRLIKYDNVSTFKRNISSCIIS